MKRDTRADRRMLAEMMGTTAYESESIAGILQHYIDRCEEVDRLAADAGMTAEIRGARVANLERAIREFCAKCNEQSCRECSLEIVWEVDE